MSRQRLDGLVWILIAAGTMSYAAALALPAMRFTGDDAFPGWVCALVPFLAFLALLAKAPLDLTGTIICSLVLVNLAMALLPIAMHSENRPIIRSFTGILIWGSIAGTYVVLFDDTNEPEIGCWCWLAAIYLSTVGSCLSEVGAAKSRKAKQAESTECAQDLS